MTRPRDRLGRPLRRGDDPSLAYPGVPERESIGADEAWREALAYLDAGLPFHAHEVLEQRWRCAPDNERAMWRALAQWGAALTHAARGNRRGAREVAKRALEGLERSPTGYSADEGSAMDGAAMDLSTVRESLRALLA